MELREIMVEITTKCYLKCRFCSAQAGKPKKKEISFKEIDKIAEYLKKNPIEKLEITGGEPLIKEELTLYTLKKIAKYSNRSSIYSSGTIFNENSYSEIKKSLINKLINAGLTEFVFNLQGDNSDTHDNLTGLNSTFVRVMDSIRNAVDCNVKTGVHFIPNRFNKDQFKSIVQLLDSVNASYIKLMRFLPTGRGKEITDFSLSYKDFKEQVIIAKALNVEFKEIEIKVGYPAKFWLHENNLKCTAATDHFVISSDGHIFPCIGFRGFDRKLKYLLIPDITLFESNLEDLIELMRNKFFNSEKTSLPIECSQCMSLESCNGGCIAQRILNSPKISKPDPLCPLHMD